jgi:hypothetical protein
MSKLKKVIKRTEKWLKDWATNDSTGFASDIQRLTGTARAATIAVEMLQKTQRYDPENAGEMQACSQGDWISINDVMNAIKILQDKEK